MGNVINALPAATQPPRTWTVMGHIDATASDLEHFELDRVDALQRADKHNSNVVMEVRRNHTHDSIKAVLGTLAAASTPLMLAAGVIGGAISALTIGPLTGLVVAGIGLGEAALLFPLSKHGFKTLRYMKHKSAEAPWSGTRRYLIGDDTRKGIQAPLLAQSKSSSAPDGMRLGDFLASTMHRFPSQRTAFIFGGHGRAMDSVGGTSVKEMAKATEIAHASTGRKLDVMVLDSCLVGNFETLLPMSDHVRYAVVSEEPVYTNVINWGSILNSVQDNASANAFHKAALDSAQGNRYHQTLTSVRMSQMGTLRNAVEKLGAALQQSMKDGHRGEIEKAFDKTTVIKDGDWISRKLEQKVDLGNLIQNLHTHVNDPAVKQAAMEAFQAYHRTVVDHRKSKKFDTTTGLSIQGPRWRHRVDAYAAETGLPQWSKALGKMRPWPMRMAASVAGGVKRLFA